MICPVPEKEGDSLSVALQSSDMEGIPVFDDSTINVRALLDKHLDDPIVSARVRERPQ